jgi:GNAT superfamily N-acetyltransferase
MTVSTAYSIEPVDLATADDGLLRETLDLVNEISRERVPEDPPLSFDAFAARVRNRPKMVVFRDWLARSPEGEVVGRGYLVRYEATTNQHLRDAEVDVLPAHRRRGLGKTLLREVVAGAGDADDLVLSFFTTDTVPAAAAALGRLGASPKLTMHTNQLQLGALDRSMVAEWAAIDPTGYRLEWIEDDVPDPLVPQVIAAYDAMNTAPRGDMAMDDWHTTPNEIREWDRSRRASGRQRKLLLALEERTGDTAGYTELNYDPKMPHVMMQQGTAVIPAHRGRGIGKWIKAAMLVRAMRDWPKATLVRTGNADSNAPMLAINTKLGFRPAWANSVWEVRITDARASLGL